MRGWLRGIRFSWFAFVMLGLFVLAVLIIAPSIAKYTAQQQQIEQLAAQNAAKQAQVDRLNDTIADWNDPNYIKAQARDRLLYVMPGETSYLIIDNLPKTAAEKAEKVSTEAQKQQGDWATTLLQSIVGSSTAKSEHRTSK